MRLSQFRVQNYRSVDSTDWIDVTSITAFVGQNEAGKSNLCEALYRINPVLGEKFDISQDWPVDNWGGKDPDAIVCEARFELVDGEVGTFLTAVGLTWSAPAVAPSADGTPPITVTQPTGTYTQAEIPQSLNLRVSRDYKNRRNFLLDFPDGNTQHIDSAKGEAWAQANLLKCVFIREYNLSKSQAELPDLAQRFREQGFERLSQDDQTMMVVLELAQVEIDDFIAKGTTAEGRTLRTFDKRQASAYLTKQFGKLWKQKRVQFDIEIDASTLNIFVIDEGVGMPVRLENRSTGFRWYVAFAWKFTHATRGAYKNTVLILEEPGIHLHYDGHRDLLNVFEGLAETNTILYTTHIATMLDEGYPERVRIVEVRDHHTKVVSGVVSTQRVPMMLIEARLGLTSSMQGLLGDRQTLIVEGGDDALILQKLSGLLVKSGKAGLSEKIYLWPAHGAPKTPMYAAFLVGNNFSGGVLLDSDAEGDLAKRKIGELYLPELSAGQKFPVLMLKDATSIPKNEPAIEDIFPDEFYLNCVNNAYRVSIKLEDLPNDGSDQITKRVERVLVARHGIKELEKRRVMKEMLKEFDGWTTIADLPGETAKYAEKLIGKINSAFA